MVDLRIIWVHENLSRDNVRKKNPNGWKNNNKEQPAKVVVAKRTREVKTIEAFHGCRFKKLSLAFLHIKGSSKKIIIIIMFLLSFFLTLYFSKVYKKPSQPNNLSFEVRFHDIIYIIV
jgi:hypothetical protein